MMVDHGFVELLRATRRRRWAQAIARYAAAGLAVGSAAGLLIGLAFVLWPNGELVAPWVAAAAGLGLAAGVIAGLVRRPTLRQTAVAVDRAAKLKDRIDSAWQFSSEPSLDAYRRLQVRDASRALRATPAAGLFPWRWPREGTWAAVTMVLAALMTVAVPDTKPAAATLTGPPRAVQLEAAALVEAVQQLDELAAALDSDELEDLAEQFRTMVSALDSDTQSSNEAILQLARMTSALESAAAPFDSTLLEQSLQNVGEGLSALDGFRPAAEMLKQGLYDRAADLLDQFGQRIGSGQQPVPSTGGLLQARLGQLAEQARSAGLSELSDGLTALGQAIKAGSQGDCEAACKRLGSVVRKYSRRVKVGRGLRAQLARLTQTKQRLSKTGGYCKGCRSGGL